MKVDEKEASHRNLTAAITLVWASPAQRFWEEKSTDESDKTPNIVSAIKKCFLKIKACVKYINYWTLLLPGEAMYWLCFWLPMWKIKLAELI